MVVPEVLWGLGTDSLERFHPHAFAAAGLLDWNALLPSLCLPESQRF